MMRSSSLILGCASLALQLPEIFPIFFQSNLFYDILGIPPLISTPNSHLSLPCLSLWITEVSLAVSLLPPSHPSVPPHPQESPATVGSIKLPPLSLTLFKLKCFTIPSVTTLCPAPSGAAAVKRFKRERTQILVPALLPVYTITGEKGLQWVNDKFMAISRQPFMLSTLTLWVGCLKKTGSQGHFLLHDPSQEPFLLGYLKEISHYTTEMAKGSLAELSLKGTFPWTLPLYCL